MNPVNSVYELMLTNSRCFRAWFSSGAYPSGNDLTYRIRELVNGGMSVAECADTVLAEFFS
jgi:hypothetical protein